MIATLGESQATLPRLVELASRGEDVVITVDGTPKARLTRAEAPSCPPTGSHIDMGSWLTELAELRRVYATNIVGTPVEQMLEEDRADRV